MSKRSDTLHDLINEQVQEASHSAKTLQDDHLEMCTRYVEQINDFYWRGFKIALMRLLMGDDLTPSDYEHARFEVPNVTEKGYYRLKGQLWRKDTEWVLHWTVSYQLPMPPTLDVDAVPRPKHVPKNVDKLEEEARQRAQANGERYSEGHPAPPMKESLGSRYDFSPAQYTLGTPFRLERKRVTFISSYPSTIVGKSANYTRAALVDAFVRGDFPVADLVRPLIQSGANDTELFLLKSAAQADRGAKATTKAVVYIDMGISPIMLEQIKTAIKDGKEVEFRMLEGWP